METNLYFRVFTFYFYKLFMAFREEPFTEYIDITSVIKRKGEKEEKNRDE